MNTSHTWLSRHQSILVFLPPYWPGLLTAHCQILLAQFSSVAQLCPTLWEPMDCSSPGYLPEFAQTHIHWISDDIQPSHSLLPPLPPALNLFSISVFSNELPLCIRWPKYWSLSFSSVLPMNIQGLFPLGLTGLIPLLTKGLSRVSSSTTIWKHQFFSAQPSLWSNSHIHTRHNPKS